MPAFDVTTPRPETIDDVPGHAVGPIEVARIAIIPAAGTGLAHACEAVTDAYRKAYGDKLDVVFRDHTCVISREQTDDELAEALAMYQRVWDFEQEARAAVVERAHVKVGEVFKSSAWPTCRDLPGCVLEALHYGDHIITDDEFVVIERVKGSRQ